MSENPVLLDISDGIAWATLNRPEARNALSSALKARLGEVLDEVAASDKVRVFVITGAGDRAFCAGADIKERAGSEPTAAEFVIAQRATIALFNRIADLPMPTIAALNGAAAGGGAEIALACDIRIAAEEAKIGLTEVNLGVIPAGGGTQRVARLLGPAQAKKLLFTGKLLTSAEAEIAGLVDEVVRAAGLADRARALASELAAKPPLALRMAKTVVDQGAAVDLRTGLELELQAAAILFDSEDRKEGMRAFLEKRTPVFKGR